MKHENPLTFGTPVKGILNKRLWRFAVFAATSVLLSVLISFFNKLPSDMVGEYIIGSLLILCLWQPFFGAPYIGLGIWWVLDLRLPLFLLILPHVLVLAFLLTSTSTPNGMSAEDREMIEDAMGRDFFEKMQEE